MLLFHFGDVPAECVARDVGHDRKILYERPLQVAPHAPAIQADFRASGDRLLDQGQQQKRLDLIVHRVNDRLTKKGDRCGPPGQREREDCTCQNILPIAGALVLLMGMPGLVLLLRIRCCARSSPCPSCWHRRPCVLPCNLFCQVRPFVAFAASTSVPCFFFNWFENPAHKHSVEVFLCFREIAPC